MLQGVVKSYDPISGMGIVVREDDMSEVYIHPGSLKDSVFRTLRQGQRLLFETEEIQGQLFITAVKVGQDGY